MRAYSPTQGWVLAMRIQLTLAAMMACLSGGTNALATEDSGQVLFSAELLFLEANRSDGANSDFSDYEAGSRFELAYETAEAVGIRFQAFEFSNNYAVGQNGAPSAIDTYNLDLEIYRRLNLARGFELEVSGGLRYNDFEDLNFGDAGQTTQFSGVGGVLGLEATQQIGFGLQGYVRGEWAFITDQSNDNGATGFDTNRTQQELGLGLARDFCLRGIQTTAHAGLEWQDWGGYQDDSDGSLGLQGFAMGLDMAY